MSNAQALAAQVQIMRGINQIQNSQTCYLARDDLRYRRLLSQCDDLIHMEPVQGYKLRGMVRALAADTYGVKHDFQNALNLGPGIAEDINFNWSQALWSLGYYSQALGKFKESVSFDKVNFSKSHNMAERIAAVSYISYLFTLASAKKIKYETTLDVDAIHALAGALGKLGLTDEKLAQGLDLAGELIRHQGLLIQVAQQSSRWDAQQQTYHIDFRLAITPRQADAMQAELLTGLAKLPQDKAFHALRIGFLSSLA